MITLKSHFQFGKLRLFRKVIATFVAVTCAVNFQAPVHAASLPIPSSVKINFKNISLPSNLGEIQETFEGKTGPGVLLIQDAHAIPDAQRKIGKIIAGFNRDYGTDSVFVEGAASELDAQLWRSFPDKNMLKKVMKGYGERGELSGGNAAAIFGVPARFYGMENRALYEQGLQLYQQAISTEPQIIEDLNEKRAALNSEKKKIYSKELFEIDQDVEKFYENTSTLTDLIRVLGKRQSPKTGTALEAVWKEISTRTVDQRLQTKDVEVREIAKKVEGYLAAKRVDQKLVKAFNARKQQWMTGAISAEAFALAINEIATSLGVTVTMSADLLRDVRRQEKLQAIEGTKLFKQLETYIREVKKSVMGDSALGARGSLEKLDERTQELRILTKLAKLELSRDEWHRLKKKIPFQQTTDHRRKTEDRESLVSVQSSVFSLLSSHLAFYKNAEQRESAFLSRANREFQDAKNSKPVVIVAGGFHAQGLSAQLRNQNVSYAVITPKIESLPDLNGYREHMRGDVSWKNYFEVENGRVNIAKAFARATRDDLLSRATSHEPRTAQDKNRERGAYNVERSLEDIRLLKSWRDQLIRDLADQNRTADAGKYLPYFDELLERQKENFVRAGMEKIEKFISGIGLLASNKNLDDAHVADLLGRFHAADLTYDILAAKDYFQIPVAATRALRSEYRAPRPAKLQSREPLASSAKRSELRTPPEIRADSQSDRYRDEALGFDGVDIEHYIVMQALLAKDEDTVARALAVLSLTSRQDREMDLTQIYAELARLGYPIEKMNAILGGHYHNPESDPYLRMDSVVGYQNADPRRQSIYEAVANSLDAMGLEIGQFGRGVKQILAWLGDSGADRVNVWTSDGVTSYRLTLLKASNGQIYIQMRAIELSEFLTVSEFEKGTVVELTVKEEIPESGNDESISQESMSDGIAQRLPFITRAGISTQTESQNKPHLINGYDEIDVLIPENIQTGYEAERAKNRVSVKFGRHSVRISDNGSGMDAARIANMFVPRQGSKKFAELGAQGVQRELSKIKVVQMKKLPKGVSFARNGEVITRVGLREDRHSDSILPGIMFEFGRLLEVTESRDSLNMNPAMIQAIKQMVDEILKAKKISDEKKALLLSMLFTGLGDKISGNPESENILHDLEANAFVAAKASGLFERLRNSGFALLPDSKVYERLLLPENLKPLYLNPRVMGWSGAEDLKNLDGQVIPGLRFGSDSDVPVVLMPMTKEALKYSRPPLPKRWSQIPVEQRIAAIVTDSAIILADNQQGRRLSELMRKQMSKQSLSQAEETERDSLLEMVLIQSSADVAVGYQFGEVKNNLRVSSFKFVEADQSGLPDEDAVNGFLIAPQGANYQQSLPADLKAADFILTRGGALKDRETGKQIAHEVKSFSRVGENIYFVTTISNSYRIMDGQGKVLFGLRKGRDIFNFDTDMKTLVLWDPANKRWQVIDLKDASVAGTVTLKGKGTVEGYQPTQVRMLPGGRKFIVEYTKQISEIIDMKGINFHDLDDPKKDEFFRGMENLSENNLLQSYSFSMQDQFEISSWGDRWAVVYITQADNSRLTYLWDLNTDKSLRIEGQAYPGNQDWIYMEENGQGTIESHFDQPAKKFILFKDGRARLELDPAFVYLPTQTPTGKLYLAKIGSNGLNFMNPLNGNIDQTRQEFQGENPIALVKEIDRSILMRRGKEDMQLPSRSADLYETGVVQIKKMASWGLGLESRFIDAVTGEEILTRLGTEYFRVVHYNPEKRETLILDEDDKLSLFTADTKQKLGKRVWSRKINNEQHIVIETANGREWIRVRRKTGETLLGRAPDPQWTKLERIPLNIPAEFDVIQYNKDNDPKYIVFSGPANGDFYYVDIDQPENPVFISASGLNPELKQESPFPSDMRIQDFAALSNGDLINLKTKHVVLNGVEKVIPMGKDMYWVEYDKSWAKSKLPHLIQKDGQGVPGSPTRIDNVKAAKKTVNGFEEVTVVVALDEVNHQFRVIHPNGQPDRFIEFPKGNKPTLLEIAPDGKSFMVNVGKSDGMGQIIIYDLTKENPLPFKLGEFESQVDRFTWGDSWIGYTNTTGDRESVMYNSKDHHSLRFMPNAGADWVDQDWIMALGNGTRIIFYKDGRQPLELLSTDSRVSVIQIADGRYFLRLFEENRMVFLDPMDGKLETISEDEFVDAHGDYIVNYLERNKASLFLPDAIKDLNGYAKFENGVISVQSKGSDQKFFYDPKDLSIPFFGGPLEMEHFFIDQDSNHSIFVDSRSGVVKELGPGLPAAGETLGRRVGRGVNEIGNPMMLLKTDDGYSLVILYLYDHQMRRQVPNKLHFEIKIPHEFDQIQFDGKYFMFSGPASGEVYYFDKDHPQDMKHVVPGQQRTKQVEAPKKQNSNTLIEEPQSQGLVQTLSDGKKVIYSKRSKGGWGRALLHTPDNQLIRNESDRPLDEVYPMGSERYLAFERKKVAGNIPVVEAYLISYESGKWVRREINTQGYFLELKLISMAEGEAILEGKQNASDPIQRWLVKSNGSLVTITDPDSKPQRANFTADGRYVVSEQGGILTFNETGAAADDAPMAITLSANYKDYQILPDSPYVLLHNTNETYSLYSLDQEKYIATGNHIVIDASGQFAVINHGKGNSMELLSLHSGKLLGSGYEIHFEHGFESGFQVVLQGNSGKEFFDRDGNEIEDAQFDFHDDRMVQRMYKNEDYYSLQFYEKGGVQPREVQYSETVQHRDYGSIYVENKQSSSADLRLTKRGGVIKLFRTVSNLSGKATNMIPPRKLWSNLWLIPHPEKPGMAYLVNEPDEEGGAVVIDGQTTIAPFWEANGYVLVRASPAGQPNKFALIAPDGNIKFLSELPEFKEPNGSMPLNLNVAGIENGKFVFVDPLDRFFAIDPEKIAKPQTQTQPQPTPKGNAVHKSSFLNGPEAPRAMLGYNEHGRKQIYERKNGQYVPAQIVESKANDPVTFEADEELGERLVQLENGDFIGWEGHWQGGHIGHRHIADRLYKFEKKNDVWVQTEITSFHMTNPKIISNGKNGLIVDFENTAGVWERVQLSTDMMPVSLSDAGQAAELRSGVTHDQRFNVFEESGLSFFDTNAKGAEAGYIDILGPAEYKDFKILPDSNYVMIENNDDTYSLYSLEHKKMLIEKAHKIQIDITGKFAVALNKQSGSPSFLMDMYSLAQGKIVLSRAEKIEIRDTEFFPGGVAVAYFQNRPSIYFMADGMPTSVTDINSEKSRFIQTFKDTNDRISFNGKTNWYSYDPMLSWRLYPGTNTMLYETFPNGPIKYEFADTSSTPWPFEFNGPNLFANGYSNQSSWFKILDDVSWLVPDYQNPGFAFLVRSNGANGAIVNDQKKVRVIEAQGYLLLQTMDEPSVFHIVDPAGRERRISEVISPADLHALDSQSGRFIFQNKKTGQFVAIEAQALFKFAENGGKNEEQNKQEIDAESMAFENAWNNHVVSGGGIREKMIKQFRSFFTEVFWNRVPEAFRGSAQKTFSAWVRKVYAAQDNEFQAWFSENWNKKQALSALPDFTFDKLEKRFQGFTEAWRELISDAAFEARMLQVPKLADRFYSNLMPSIPLAAEKWEWLDGHALSRSSLELLGLGWVPQSYQSAKDIETITAWLDSQTGQNIESKLTVISFLSAVSARGEESHQTLMRQIGLLAKPSLARYGREFWKWVGGADLDSLKNLIQGTTDISELGEAGIYADWMLHEGDPVREKPVAEDFNPKVLERWNVPGRGLRLSQLIRFVLGQSRDGVIPDMQLLKEGLSSLPDADENIEAQLVADIRNQRESGAYTAEIVQNILDAIRARMKQDPNFKSGSAHVDHFHDAKGFHEVVRDNGTGALNALALLIPLTTKSAGAQNDTAGFFGTGKYTVFNGVDQVEFISNNGQQAFRFVFEMARQEDGSVKSVILKNVETLDPKSFELGVSIVRRANLEHSLPIIDQKIARRNWKVFAGLSQTDQFKIEVANYDGQFESLFSAKETPVLMGSVAFGDLKDREGNPKRLKIWQTKNLPLQIVDGNGLRVSSRREEFLALVPKALRDHEKEFGMVIQIPLPLVRSRDRFKDENDHMREIQMYVALAFYRALAWKTLTQNSPQFAFRGYPHDWATNPAYLNVMQRVLVDDQAIAVLRSHWPQAQANHQIMNVVRGFDNGFDIAATYDLLESLADAEMRGDSNVMKLVSLLPIEQEGGARLLDRMIKIQSQIAANKEAARLLAEAAGGSRSVEDDGFDGQRVAQARWYAQDDNPRVIPENEMSLEEKAFVEFVRKVGALFGFEHVMLAENMKSPGVFENGLLGRRVLFNRTAVQASGARKGQVHFATNNVIHEFAHLLEFIAGKDERDLSAFTLVTDSGEFTHQSRGLFADCMKQVASMMYVAGIVYPSVARSELRADDAAVLSEHDTTVVRNAESRYRAWIEQLQQMASKLDPKGLSVAQGLATQILNLNPAVKRKPTEQMFYDYLSAVGENRLVSQRAVELDADQWEAELTRRMDLISRTLAELSEVSSNASFEKAFELLRLKTPSMIRNAAEVAALITWAEVIIQGNVADELAKYGDAVQKLLNPTASVSDTYLGKEDLISMPYSFAETLSSQKGYQKYIEITPAVRDVLESFSHPEKWRFKNLADRYFAMGLSQLSLPDLLAVARDYSVFGTTVNDASTLATAERDIARILLDPELAVRGGHPLNHYFQNMEMDETKMILREVFYRWESAGMQIKSRSYSRFSPVYLAAGADLKVVTEMGDALHDAFEADHTDARGRFKEVTMSLLLNNSKQLTVAAAPSMVEVNKGYVHETLEQEMALPSDLFGKRFRPVIRKNSDGVYSVMVVSSREVLSAKDLQDPARLEIYRAAYLRVVQILVAMIERGVDFKRDGKKVVIQIDQLSSRLFPQAKGTLDVDDFLKRNNLERLVNPLSRSEVRKIVQGDELREYFPIQGIRGWLQTVSILARWLFQKSARTKWAEIRKNRADLLKLAKKYYGKDAKKNLKRQFNGMNRGAMGRLILSYDVNGKLTGMAALTSILDTPFRAWLRSDAVIFRNYLLTAMDGVLIDAMIDSDSSRNEILGSMLAKDAHPFKAIHYFPGTDGRSQALREALGLAAVNADFRIFSVAAKNWTAIRSDKEITELGAVQNYANGLTRRRLISLATQAGLGVAIAGAGIYDYFVANKWLGRHAVYPKAKWVAAVMSYSRSKQWKSAWGDNFEIVSSLNPYDKNGKPIGLLRVEGNEVNSFNRNTHNSAQNRAVFLIGKSGEPILISTDEYLREKDSGKYGAQNYPFAAQIGPVAWHPSDWSALSKSGERILPGFNPRLAEWHQSAWDGAKVLLIKTSTGMEKIEFPGFDPFGKTGMFNADKLEKRLNSIPNIEWGVFVDAGTTGVDPLQLNPPYVLAMKAKKYYFFLQYWPQIKVWLGLGVAGYAVSWVIRRKMAAAAALESASMNLPRNKRSEMRLGDLGSFGIKDYFVNPSVEALSASDRIDSIPADLQMDMRPVRGSLISPAMFGYLRALRRMINPDAFEKTKSKEMKALYLAGGADIATLIHGLGVQNATIIDSTPISLDHFQSALKNWDTIESTPGELTPRPWTVRGYLENKFEYGFGGSPQDDGMYFMEEKIIAELKLLGVPRKSVKPKIQNGHFQLTFEWSPTGRDDDRVSFNYTWIEGDATNEKLWGEGNDFVLIKAGYDLLDHVFAKIHDLIASMAPDSYLLSDDAVTPGGVLGSLMFRSANSMVPVHNGFSYEPLSDEALDYRRALALKLVNLHPEIKADALMYGWALNIYRRSEMRDHKSISRGAIVSGVTALVAGWTAGYMQGGMKLVLDSGKLAESQVLRYKNWMEWLSNAELNSFWLAGFVGYFMIVWRLKAAEFLLLYGGFLFFTNAFSIDKSIAAVGVALVHLWLQQTSEPAKRSEARIKKNVSESKLAQKYQDPRLKEFFNLFESVTNRLFAKDAFWIKRSHSVEMLRGEMLARLGKEKISKVMRYLRAMEMYLNGELPSSALLRSLGVELYQDVGAKSGRFLLLTPEARDEFSGRLKKIIEDVQNKTGREPVILEVAAGYGDLTNHLKPQFPNLRMIATDGFYSPIVKNGNLYDSAEIAQNGVQKLRSKDILDQSFRKKFGISKRQPVIVIGGMLPPDADVELDLLRQNGIDHMLIVQGYEPRSHRKASGLVSWEANSKYWHVDEDRMLSRNWFSSVFSIEGPVTSAMRRYDRLKRSDKQAAKKINPPAQPDPWAFTVRSAFLESFETAVANAFDESFGDDLRSVALNDLIVKETPKMTYHFSLRKKEPAVSWLDMQMAQNVEAEDLLDLMADYIDAALPSLQMMQSIVDKTSLNQNQRDEFIELLHRNLETNRHYRTKIETQQLIDYFRSYLALHVVQKSPVNMDDHLTAREKAVRASMLTGGADSRTERLRAVASRSEARELKSLKAGRVSMDLRAGEFGNRDVALAFVPALLKFWHEKTFVFPVDKVKSFNVDDSFVSEVDGKKFWQIFIQHDLKGSQRGAEERENHERYGNHLWVVADESGQIRMMVPAEYDAEMRAVRQSIGTTSQLVQIYHPGTTYGDENYFELAVLGLSQRGFSYWTEGRNKEISYLSGLQRDARVEWDEQGSWIIVHAAGSELDTEGLSGLKIADGVTTAFEVINAVRSQKHESELESFAHDLIAGAWIAKGDDRETLKRSYRSQKGKLSDDEILEFAALYIAAIRNHFNVDEMTAIADAFRKSVQSHFDEQVIAQQKRELTQLEEEGNFASDAEVLTQGLQDALDWFQHGMIFKEPENNEVKIWSSNDLEQMASAAADLDLFAVKMIEELGAAQHGVSGRDADFAEYDRNRARADFVRARLILAELKKLPQSKNPTKDWKDSDFNAWSFNGLFRKYLKDEAGNLDRLYQHYAVHQPERFVDYLSAISEEFSAGTDDFFNHYVWLGSGEQRIAELLEGGVADLETEEEPLETAGKAIPARSFRDWSAKYFEHIKKSWSDLLEDDKGLIKTLRIEVVEHRARIYIPSLKWNGASYDLIEIMDRSRPGIWQPEALEFDGKNYHWFAYLKEVESSTGRSEARVPLAPLTDDIHAVESDLNITRAMLNGLTVGNYFKMISAHLTQLEQDLARIQAIDKTLAAEFRNFVEDVSAGASALNQGDVMEAMVRYERMTELTIELESAVSAARDALLYGADDIRKSMRKTPLTNGALQEEFEKFKPIEKMTADLTQAAGALHVLLHATRSRMNAAREKVRARWLTRDKQFFDWFAEKAQTISDLVYPANPKAPDQSLIVSGEKSKRSEMRGVTQEFKDFAAVITGVKQSQNRSELARDMVAAIRAEGLDSFGSKLRAAANVVLLEAADQRFKSQNINIENSVSKPALAAWMAQKSASASVQVNGSQVMVRIAHDMSELHGAPLREQAAQVALAKIMEIYHVAFSPVGKIAHELEWTAAIKKNGGQMIPAESADDKILQGEIAFGVIADADFAPLKNPSLRAIATDSSEQETLDFHLLVAEYYIRYLIAARIYAGGGSEAVNIESVLTSLQLQGIAKFEKGRIVVSRKGIAAELQAEMARQTVTQQSA